MQRGFGLATDVMKKDERRKLIAIVSPQRYNAVWVYQQRAICGSGRVILSINFPVLSFSSVFFYNFPTKRIITE
jgi:hypothetical protein